MSQEVIRLKTQEQNGTLAFPDPDTVTLARVRDVVLPAAVRHRDEIAQLSDRDEALTKADELRRILERFRRYLQDREGRDLIAAECRLTDALVGDLLGPVEPGQRTDLEPSHACEGSTQGILRADRYRCRIMSAAKHAGKLEEYLAEGVVGQNRIIERFQRWQKVNDPEAPKVEAGDFRTSLDGIADASVTLILTDPPYAASALPLYGKLAELAARVLVDGGSLVCYTGQATMPDVLPLLSQCLRYWWTFALTHEHGGQQLPGKWVMVEWKPLLWFVKGRRLGREYVADRLRGSRPEKAHHEWAQGIEEVVPLIEKLTQPGELILDPFAGSGAFGRAAVALGRRFVGVDLDPSSDKGVAS